MKIIFFCGCLEPGKDGVGDYTRRLAGELMRQGHSTAVIALNERRRPTGIHETQSEPISNIPILRLSASTSWERRIERAKSYIQIFQPNLISLQYVPYSFNRKGIPFFLNRKLAKISKLTLAKWIITIHEPFIGYSIKGLKNAFTRYFQITSLKRLNRHLKFEVIYTTNAYYQKMIKSIGLTDCLILGLFGNISIYDFDNIYCRTSQMKELTAIYFGSAPQLEQLCIFKKKLSAFLEELHTPFVLFLCGSTGVYGSEFIKLVKDCFTKDNHSVNVLGEMSSKELSILFSKADFAISRVPARLVGKSGSSISMLEHGLPLWLILSDDNDTLAAIDFRKDLCLQDISIIDEYINKPKTLINRLPIIASQFVNDLDITKSNLCRRQ